MSLHRFFLEEQVIANERADAFALRLASDDRQHVRALRLAPGEHIAVVDAAADYFECEVLSVGADVMVRVCRRAEMPDIADVMLVAGLAKADKMDTVVRAGTELGVSTFVPFASARSVVRLDAAKEAKRLARWRTIAKSAAMQSGQPRIPRVEPVGDISRICALLREVAGVLICWEEAEDEMGIGRALARMRAQADTAPFEGSLAVVVGPEGGFTHDEVDAMRACNDRACVVSLGHTILRAETAGVVACALALYELGALGGVGGTA